MLAQPAVDDEVRPFIDTVSAMPIQYVPRGYVQADGSLLSLLNNALSNWRAIPEDVRAWLVKPQRIGFDEYRLRFMFADGDYAYDQTAEGYGRNPGDVNWGGLYITSRSKLVRRHIAIRNGNDAVVHEVGHAIDYTYNLLAPGGTGSARRLTEDPPFTTLWNASSPTIPSTLYGATNILEWFAELWKCQIPRSAAPSGDPTLFVQLAGGDRTRATAIRQAFTERLPMPSFTF